MKNKTLRTWGITSLLILTLAAIAWAADSISVPVSVTIPSVPGLNAPPFGNAAGTNLAAVTDEAVAETESIQKESLRQTSTGTTAVQTIYSR